MNNLGKAEDSQTVKSSQEFDAFGRHPASAEADEPNTRKNGLQLVGELSAMQVPGLFPGGQKNGRASRHDPDR